MLTTCSMVKAIIITSSTCRRWTREECLVVTLSSRPPRLPTTRPSNIMLCKEATGITPNSNSSSSRCSMVLDIRSTRAWSILQPTWRVKVDSRAKSRIKNVCQTRQASLRSFNGRSSQLSFRTYESAMTFRGCSRLWPTRLSSRTKITTC